MNIYDLDPKAIWKNFSALNSIPRPSQKEEKVICFIKKFGESLGLRTTIDPTGNIIIRKPATLGMGNRKMTTLQSHLDMVCQKNDDIIFDFETEGIKMYIDNGWVAANGTTLGADNGIGVAAIMGILESKDIPHPAIEALFTVDEESGLNGASKLKARVLKGDILLNLDTAEDDIIVIGSSGGIDVTGTKEFEAEKISRPGIFIEIKGLKGGHSGMDINKGHGNANVLLARFLFEGLENNIQLIHIDSGGLRNVIPREAKAKFFIKDIPKYFAKAEILKADIFNEYHSVEKDLIINISKEKMEGEALTSNDSMLIIKAITTAHNGVYRMNPDTYGLVDHPIIFQELS